MRVLERNALRKVASVRKAFVGLALLGAGACTNASPPPIEPLPPEAPPPPPVRAGDCRGADALFGSGVELPRDIACVRALALGEAAKCPDRSAALEGLAATALGQIAKEHASAIVSPDGAFALEKRLDATLLYRLDTEGAHLAYVAQGGPLGGVVNAELDGHRLIVSRTDALAIIDVDTGATHAIDDALRWVHLGDAFVVAGRHTVRRFDATTFDLASTATPIGDATEGGALENPFDLDGSTDGKMVFAGNVVASFETGHAFTFGSLATFDPTDGRALFCDHGRAVVVDLTNEVELTRFDASDGLCTSSHAGFGDHGKLLAWFSTGDPDGVVGHVFEVSSGRTTLLKEPDQAAGGVWLSAWVDDRGGVCLGRAGKGWVRPICAWTLQSGRLVRTGLREPSHDPSQPRGPLTPGQPFESARSPEGKRYAGVGYKDASADGSLGADLRLSIVDRGTGIATKSVLLNKGMFGITWTGPATAVPPAVAWISATRVLFTGGSPPQLESYVYDLTTDDVANLGLVEPTPSPFFVTLPSGQLLDTRTMKAIDVHADVDAIKGAPTLPPVCAKG